MQNVCISCQYCGIIQNPWHKISWFDDGFGCTVIILNRKTDDTIKVQCTSIEQEEESS